MTMREYYEMGMREGMELREKVEESGVLVREEFISEYYRHAKVYEYEGNTYYIDCILGIINIL